MMEKEWNNSLYGISKRSAEAKHESCLAKADSSLKDEFHNLNNLLNKITTHSGMARYELETKGIDLEKLEDEVKKLVELLNNLEEYALKIADILKKLHSAISIK